MLSIEIICTFIRLGNYLLIKGLFSIPHNIVYVEVWLFIAVGG